MMAVETGYTDGTTRVVVFCPDAGSELTGLSYLRDYVEERMARRGGCLT